MTLGKQTRRKQQRGIAMIMALLALLLLAVIGTAFMFMNTSETSANGNYKDSQKAYFASRAGIENVRALLWSNAGLKASASSLQMPNPTPAVLGNGMIYVLNPAAGEAIDPTVNPVDDELCHEQFVALVNAGLTPAVAGAPCGTGAITELMPPASGYYSTQTLTSADTGTTAPLPFKWVRITNKQNLMGTVVDPTVVGPTVAFQRVDKTQPDPSQVCLGIDGQERATASCAAWNLANLTNQVTPVWTLTSLAVTPNGSHRMTQMEVAYLPPLFPPGTISTEAPVTLKGSYSIQSDDYCTCTCTRNSSTGKTTCVNKAGAACISSPNAIYTAGTITQNGTSGVVVSTLGSTIFTASAQNQPWPYNIPKLIDTYKQSAQNAATSVPWNYNCSGTPNFSSMPPVYANCGTQSNQQFGIFPPNLLTNGDESGAQPVAVYVPGSISLHSNNTSGAGVLIVDGDLQIDGGLTFYGLLLVRGKVSFTGGGSAATNIFGAILAGEDVSATDQAVSDSFGGSINFTYDTCALRQAGPPGPPKLLATHELMY